MSAGTLALILNFAFVLILVIGFLIGLWRGVKKASLNLGITLAGVLIGFFVSGPITKAVLGIKIAEGQTISQYIVSLITQNADIKLLYDSTPSLQQTIAGLPYAIANPVVFLVVSIAIMLVAYLIYRIIACFIKKKDKEGNKIKQYRIAGGAVGIAKALILTIFITMPLVSLIGTANDLINTPTSNIVSAAETNDDKDEGLLSSVVPKQVADIVDGLDTSAFGVLGNMFGLDNATFDYMSAFKVNDETIHIRKEINNVVEVYGAYEVITDTFNAGGTNKFKDINFDKIDKSIQTLLNSKFYKTVISDAAFNLISDSQHYSFFNGLREGQLGEIFNQISANISNYDGAKSDYFANDINNIYSAFKTLANTGALDDAFSGGDGIVDKIKVLGLKYPVNLTQALENLFATNIFQTSAPAVINFAVDNLELGIEKIELEAEKVDWTETNKHLAENFTSLISTYSKMEVDITEILKSPESLLTKDSQVDDIVGLFGDLGQMIDQINNMQIYYKPTEPEETQPESKPLFVNAEGKSIVEALLEENEFTIPENLANDEKYKPENQERYKNFFTYLAEPLARVKELDLYSMINGGADANALLKTFATELAKDAKIQQNNPEKDIENTLELIILRLYDIPKTNEIIIPKLKSMNNSLVDFNQLEGRADWENDIAQISNLLVTLNEKAKEGQTYLDLVLQEGGAEELMKKISGKDGGLTITEVLKPVLSAKSTQKLKTEIFSTFKSVLDKLLSGEVTIDATKATADNAEKVCQVFEKFMDLYAEYNSGKNTLEALLQDDTARPKVVALKDILQENATNEGDLFYDTYTKLNEKLQSLSSLLGDASV